MKIHKQIGHCSFKVVGVLKGEYWGAICGSYLKKQSQCTTDNRKVTCKKCLAIIKKQEATDGI